MSGSLGDMGNLLKQAQKMQRELDRVREELRGTTVEGTDRARLVRVVVTGDRRVEGLELDPALVAEGDRAKIENGVLEALRDGLGKAEAVREKNLSAVTGGMSLPGLF